MKAGGRLLDQERKEQQKAEAAAQGRQEHVGRNPAPLGAEYAESGGFDSYGSILKHQDPDLFDLVRGAINFFLR